MKRSRNFCPRRAPKSPTRTFLVHARRQLDAAPPHLNPAIALYVQLAPKIQTLSLFDLQIFAADMEQAARAGEAEANHAHEIVTALEALAPEPALIAPSGF